MSTTVPEAARRTTTTWCGRAAAALAVSAAVLHAGSLAEHTPSPGSAALTLVMVAGCLYCARHLWMRGDQRDWILVTVMNVAMIMVHLTTMSPDRAAGGHHGHAVPPVAGAAAGASIPPLMAAALAVAAAEVLLAVSVVFHRTRRGMDPATAAARPRWSGTLST
ncbi:hypothetical protein RAJCM14343_0683 [Rhodococcus aetherivorans]|jgi:hypothetical protein|uniref:Integral membrane protein n=1 Tax=Rhodococcus aetherivorans TaxID=191292 RepID=A0ABQ0YG14_9NOCA|nr:MULTISPECIES: hypothetical protein [Rhodococcus]ETT26298.1 hypothetical protein RR21198_3062 [Rhodococcus rhodochrous ATCC 21198]KDE10166.1 membrane protein [Rhodococcus aetherivorans]MBC2592213.1 hypothetical protein [Rhodococcus aetherivorans]NGP28272.1 hypothetical protein [Rhodococcus aetherivorans]PND52725.1 hypothetical protein CQZ88_07145 [Rhodococcus sp. ENV425]